MFIYPIREYPFPVGWQPLPDFLTQVSPSTQAVIKTVNQHGRLWSSTIAASLRLFAIALLGAVTNSFGVRAQGL